MENKGVYIVIFAVGIGLFLIAIVTMIIVVITSTSDGKVEDGSTTSSVTSKHCLLTNEAVKNQTFHLGTPNLELVHCPSSSRDFVGDGVCDDRANTKGCVYDGGDCCVAGRNIDRCNKCLCKQCATGDYSFICNQTIGNTSTPLPNTKSQFDF